MFSPRTAHQQTNLIKWRKSDLQLATAQASLVRLIARHWTCTDAQSHSSLGRLLGGEWQKPRVSHGFNVLVGEASINFAMQSIKSSCDRPIQDRRHDLSV
jgi:hypothetical protein